MKKNIENSLLLFLFIVLLSFTTDAGKEVGTWTGEDKGDVGSIVFDEGGYAAFVIDGQTMGGKSFMQNGKELSMKYEIDYQQTPIQIDFIFYLPTMQQEIARMKGIMEFEGENQMKLAINFSTNNNTRPTHFNDDNSVIFNKTN